MSQLLRFNSRSIDSAGIFASVFCMLHCLALPVFIILGLDSILWITELEWVEILILTFSFTIGIVAFFGGYRIHKQHFVPILFSAGFLLLVNGEAVGQEWLGLGLSLAGAAVIAYAHYQNMILKLKTAVHVK